MWFIHWRHQTQQALQKSKESIQTKLRDFNFDIRSSLRIPSPTYHPKPNLYPGRLWRLEWGDMEEERELFTPNGTFQPSTANTSNVTYSVIGPGIAAAQSPTYKAYF